MGNDLKYGLILGVVVLLIFVGWMAINSGKKDVQTADTLASAPQTPAPDFDILAPPVEAPAAGGQAFPAATTETRAPLATVEITRPAETVPVRQSSRDMFDPQAQSPSNFGAAAPAGGNVVIPTTTGRPVVGPIIPSLDQSVPVTEAPMEVAPAETTYTVAKGDDLSKISMKFYGTTKRWPDIVKANAGLNPNMLKIGQKLVIPGVEPQTAPAAADSMAVDPFAVDAGTASAARTHTVAKGDTLYSIAEKYYGNGNSWRKILDANSSKISSPQALRAGMTLAIP